MFLYAVARALSLKHNTELAVDTSYYSGEFQSQLPNNVHRYFELDVFNINVKEITHYDDKVLRRVRSRRLYKRMRAILPCILLNSFGEKKHFVHFVEKGPQFDKSVLDLPDNVLLEGYYVSYKYFDHCSDIIKKEFSFRNSPDNYNQEMIKKITSVDSVSIHVRRGDYVTNKVVAEKFGPCTLDYYKSAVAYVADKIKSPHFFVFSDDPEWVNDHFKLDYPVDYLTHNVGNKNYEDLRLMSLCNHNIVANSCFSWWGAWLNQNSNKTVVCPEPAFDILDIRDEDFYPENWVKIPK